jgi:hypothetical protein
LIVGYARVSTTERNLGLRHDELKPAFDDSVDVTDAQDQFRHVYWIGGGSGAGKSTIARRLAAEHGLKHYATDDVMGDHVKRSGPEECPLLHKFMSLDMDETWVNRSPITPPLIATRACLLHLRTGVLRHEFLGPLALDVHRVDISFRVQSEAVRPIQISRPLLAVFP